MLARMMAIGSVGVVGTALAAGVQQDTQTQPAETAPLLEIHTEGMGRWPVAPKDAGLYRAFTMLGDRLDDLAREFEMDEHQASGMAFAWDLLTSGVALRITESDAAPGFAANAAFSPAEGVDAADLFDAARQLIEFSGLPAEQQGGVTQLSTPAGPASLESSDGALRLSFNDAPMLDTAVSSMLLPDGVTPILSGRGDIGGLIRTFSPESADNFEQLAQMPGGAGFASFFGPDAPYITFAVGADDTRLHAVSRSTNAVTLMESQGYDPEGGFSQDDLKLVPADAVRVIATPIATRQIAEVFELLEAETGENPLREINDALGIDFAGDVLANIGPELLVYQSESTGGGGVSSAVLIANVADPATLGTAHARIVERANEFGQGMGEGYARIRTFDIDGVGAFTINTPGLPIPLDPAWTILNGKLIVALSPGSLSAAIAQVRGADTSVLDNERFQRAVGSRMPDGSVATLTFTDAPRLARKGYGLTKMLLAGFANGVRSPANPDRVNFELMPPYHEFIAGVEPSGSISWFEGDDLWNHSVGDRSVTVQMAALAGSLADLQAIAAPAFAAGVMLPALSQARQTAQELKGATQVRSLAQAALVYATNNNDKGPDSVEALIEDGYVVREMLDSPMGPAIDGGPDIVLRTDRPEMAASFDADFVIAIDRAMVVNGYGKVNIAFADSSAQTVDMQTLRVILDQPVNRGAAVAFQLPGF